MYSYDVIDPVCDVTASCVDVVIVDNLSDSGLVSLAVVTAQPPSWSRGRRSDAVTSSTDCCRCLGVRATDIVSGVDSGTVHI